MRSSLVLAMHDYKPEQTVPLTEPCKHGKWNNNKELYVYKTLE